MVARPKTTATKLIPAVSYCRMSGDKQEASIPRQLDEIREFARRNGYEIIREYADAGEHGDADDREDFNRMIRDAEKRGEFRAILVWDDNRFSRFDTLTLNFFLYRIREAEVDFVTLTKGRPLNYDDIGEMMLTSINGHNGNKFLKDLGRVVASGLRRAAKLGHRTAKAPFGYLNAGRAKIAVDDETAAIVRWLFDTMLAREVSLRQLCRELMAKGIKSPAGKARWSPASLRVLFSNRAYLGEKVYGKVATGRHTRILSGELTSVGRKDRESVSRQSLDDCIVVKDAYPAIIDAATFAAVNAILDGRETTKPARPNAYLLSGLIYCGQCGGRCYGTQCGRRADGTPYRSYICASRHAGGISCCKPECGHNIRADIVEAAVKQAIAERFLSDEQIAEIANWQREHVADIRGSAAKKVALLDKRHTAAAAKVERLESRLGDDVPADMLDSLYKQLRAAKSERDSLALELSAATAIADRTAEAVNSSSRENIARLAEIREHIIGAPSDIARRMLANVVDKIVLITKPGISNRIAGKPIRVLEEIKISLRRDILSSDNQSLDYLPLDIFPQSLEIKAAE